MLEELKIRDFEEVYGLLEDSFPAEERRSFEGQRQLLERPDYKILGLRGDSLKGLAAVYDREGFLFLEHLAVSESCRNQGLGAELLKLLSERGKPIVLEVEPPESELARRRIGFYQRNGFFLNEYPYVQPPLAAGRPVELLLMTSGKALSQEEFQRVKTILYKDVYGWDGNEKNGK